MSLRGWCGAIGLAWAARHPKRVSRLVILNTSAFPLPEGKRIPWQLALVRDWRISGWAVRSFNAFAVMASYVACRRGMSSAVRRGYLWPYDSWKNRIAILRFVQDIPLGPGDPSYGLLLRIHAGLAHFREAPVLICWGGRDFVFDDTFLEQWMSELPKAELRRFPEAGHYVLEDAPDEIALAVRDFLERTPDSEP